MNFFEWLMLRSEIKSTNTERARACRTCEVLRNELNRVSNEKQQLLNVVLERSEPKAPEPVVVHEPRNGPMQPIADFGAMAKGWEAKRRALEAEDLAKAIALKKESAQAEIAKRNAELDKEVENA